MKKEKYKELRSCPTLKMIRGRLQDIEKKLNITGWEKRDRMDEEKISTVVKELREKIKIDFCNKQTDEGYPISFGNSKYSWMPQDWWDKFDSIIASLKEIEKGETNET